MNEIDEIRSQMAQIRHDLHHDVSNVVTGVSEVVNGVSGVLDWRAVLRDHPYILLGSALAAGYLVVPRRKKVVEPIQNNLGSMTVPEQVPRKKIRPLSFALDFFWPIASQAAQAYALIWIEKRLKDHLQIGPQADRSEERFGSDYRRPTSGYPR